VKPVKNGKVNPEFASYYSGYEKRESCNVGGEVIGERKKST
jgi:hypothetical protein